MNRVTTLHAHVMVVCVCIDLCVCVCVYRSLCVGVCVLISNTILLRVLCGFFILLGLHVVPNDIFVVSQLSQMLGCALIATESGGHGHEVQGQ